ncbi:MAG: hypothetical protein AUI36_41635 [Cyanobacteria bacterium 13_1_40CM_2_61_4]|nr:MAG: hypothetical protein AUI36_41635 [Cyanobacteria bacterium 13_1_40CM_2_61_4]
MISGLYRNVPSWVIDFEESDILQARKHEVAFKHLQETVLPLWTKNAEEEKKKTGKSTGEHQGRLQYWWLLKRRRGELIRGINKLSRYIVCSAVTKRPIFEFVSRFVRPSNALKAFLLEDDYSFGILQSGIHWAWFTAKCSTLTERYRYTPDTVFDTFAWPQEPTLKQVQAVATAAAALRGLRRKTMAVNGWSLRDLYRTLELPGQNPLRDAHQELDAAVRAAYGMKPNEDPLAFLLALNHAVAEREKKGEPVVGPGLPPCVRDLAPLLTDDCVQPPGLTN